MRGFSRLDILGRRAVLHFDTPVEPARLVHSQDLELVVLGDAFFAERQAFPEIMLRRQKILNGAPAWVHVARQHLHSGEKGMALATGQRGRALRRHYDFEHEVDEGDGRPQQFDQCALSRASQRGASRGRASDDNLAQRRLRGRASLEQQPCQVLERCRRVARAVEQLRGRKPVHMLLVRAPLPLCGMQARHTPSPTTQPQSFVARRCRCIFWASAPSLRCSRALNWRPAPWPGALTPA